MKRSTSRWIAGVGVGSIVHIGLFWLVGVLSEPADRSRERHEKGASLQFIGADTVELSPVMQQQIELFDPKPLLLPTEWNAVVTRLNRLEAYVDDDADLFVDYEPVFRSEDGNFVGSFGNSWRPAGSPKENQLAFPFAVTERFGRASISRSQEEIDGISLEVVRVGTGEFVYSRSHYNNAAQEIMEFEELWEPASFLVQIVDSFQVSVPSTARSSGFPEIDQKLGVLIMRDLLPKGLLANGSYLVWISR